MTDPDTPEDTIPAAVPILPPEMRATDQLDGLDAILAAANRGDRIILNPPRGYEQPWWQQTVDASTSTLTYEQLFECIQSMQRRDQERADAIRRWAYGFGAHPDGPLYARRRPRFVDITEA